MSSRMQVFCAYRDPTNGLAIRELNSTHVKDYYSRLSETEYYYSTEVIDNYFSSC